MEEEASTSRQPLVPRKAKINVPVGFRFKPRDDELIVHYLKPKVYNQPLPPNIIEEVELYSYSPEALTEDPNGDRKGETEWFFFTPRNRKYRNGSRPGRGTGDGYWKATGADKQVRYQGKIEGLKKTLVYYKGNPKPSGGKKTNWIMHEYVLKDPPPRERAGIDDMKLDNWVLCKVYNKKQGKKLEGEISGKGKGVHGGAPPQKEEEEEQKSSITIAASPQISVNQKQQQNGGSKIMNQHQIAVDHQNGGSNIMDPPQFQQCNNMMLPQSTNIPPMPYNYSDGSYGSTSGFSDFPLGFTQALPWNGNYVPIDAPILPQFGPTGSSEYPLNMMIDDQLQIKSIPPFTDDERKFHMGLWENLDLSFTHEDKNATKTKTIS